METTRTFDQAFRLLEIVREKNSSLDQLQRVYSSGLIGDVLDANLDEFTPEKRDVIRYLLGLKPLREAGPGPAVRRNILPIDRSKPFNPAEFIGQGWSVWRGPAYGNGLEGDEERDQEAAALTEINLDEVQLAPCFRQGRAVATGEERLNRVKIKADDGRIRLDENAFKAFWENREILPARFKDRWNGTIQFIFFDGVVLRGPDGIRYALCLCFSAGGSWRWHCFWLIGDRDAGVPTAVLVD